MKQGPIIELNWFEWIMAFITGGARNYQAMMLGWKDPTNAPEENKFGNNIEGIAAEIAFCKWKNIFWHCNVGDPTASDVGPWELRCNCSRTFHDMVLRPDSKDELKRNKIWIAVRILPMKMKSKFEIYGWAWGHEVMQNKDDTCKWFRLGDPSRPKAWWYPRSMLHSMDELPGAEETLRLMQQREAAE